MDKRILTISALAVYNRKEMPSIRLQGRWLEKLGLGIGKKVIVSCVGYGEINIKLVEKS